MYWNNRILRRLEGKGTSFEEPAYCITEVFYDEDDSIIGWTDPKTVYSETLEGLVDVLDWMKEALKKPVLDEEELLTERGLNDL